MTAHALTLGEWLTVHARLPTDRLAHAVALQQKNGGRIGEILLALGAISPRDWLRGLSAQNIATLSTDRLWEADRSCQDTDDILHYSTLAFIPLLLNEHIAIATTEITESLREWCAKQYDAPYHFHLITRRDFHAYMLTHFSSALTEHACESLYHNRPDFSAKQPITISQRLGLLTFLVSLLALAIFNPHATWYGAMIAITLFYLANLTFKLLLLVMAPVGLRKHALWRSTAEALEDKDLPCYSILVPLFKESPAVLTQIIASIGALDYPKTKLDVWLITEDDDPATRDALKALTPPDYFRILSVPTSHPRTKPKACNIAMPFIRGEFVTIYDAEDRPEPNQLRLSIAAFSHSHPRVACLQAPLAYFNRRENLLTRLFAIEYSALFKMLLPALNRLRIPIPLGGTSNHLRTSALRAVGGWDPYNVTEDADLGIRLAYHGFTTDMLPSITYEESPISLAAWLKQRSRWIKGYIQTWLVYMRDPLSLLAKLGIPAFFGFQFFVGAPAITFLLAPIFWGFSLLMVSGYAPVLKLPYWLMLCCWLTLVLGFTVQWATAAMAVRREEWRGMQIAQHLYPFYWLLHSIACVKALWQLMTKPHYWEKTSHGRSKFFAMKQPHAQVE
jgi:cellulose synthase/poly-beta-1,6-N-acetylglucosamine synthase-like glycosyltransferase